MLRHGASLTVLNCVRATTAFPYIMMRLISVLLWLMWDQKGNTPVQEALFWGNEEVAEVFLRRGVVPAVDAVSVAPSALTLAQ